MLPAAQRLRSTADFSETTRRGAKGARGCVVVYLVRSAESSPPRVGLIVGKAVGGSVQRHRAARRIRGALREVLPGLPLGTRLVVRALRGADVDPALRDDLASAVAAASSRQPRIPT
jgi:ribonuclease P protein component